MSVRQLYGLQIVEAEIASAEKEIAAAQAKLAADAELKAAQAALTVAKSDLDTLLKEQRQNDGDIADITTKINTANTSLYSGRVRSPRELTDLQLEMDSLSRRLAPFEEKALGYMEQIESAQAAVRDCEGGLKAVEDIRREEHRELQTRLGELATRLEGLQKQRGDKAALIAPDELNFYIEIKKRRGVAVARVEKGVCACRITLPTAELQRARGGRVVQCSSCARILFAE
ncbi:MAG: hypothetical protein FWF18_02495 [Dehalococcoidia bacterium]|nr:hypothetical protein [Dehalococcoidia bacterium]